MAKTGVIGGSGLYQIAGLEKTDERVMDTPFGETSAALLSGRLQGKEVVFLARHGTAHTMLPSEVNYRANIYAMKTLGVERIISVSSVGSLKEHIRPRDMVIPDQFVDRTHRRPTTFFGEGIVAHVSFGDPVCAELAALLAHAGRDCDATVHQGGTYVTMEGPAFSTRAESNLYRAWGMDIIGMTNMVEARLCREAEICYATLAMVTDYDCWRASDEVSVEKILENLKANGANAQNIVRSAIRELPEQRSCPCREALSDAVVTPRDKIPKKTRKKLSPIIGRLFSS